MEIRVNVQVKNIRRYHVITLPASGFSGFVTVRDLRKALSVHTFLGRRSDLDPTRHYPYSLFLYRGDATRYDERYRDELENHQLLPDGASVVLWRRPRPLLAPISARPCELKHVANAVY